MKRFKNKKQKNEKGFAILEAIAFLMAFVVLTVYVVDFFTVIHTGIVNSIHSRTYLFATLQHRSNIGWLRQESLQTTPVNHDFRPIHARFHVIRAENIPNTNLHPSGRILSAVNDEDRVRPESNIRDRATTIAIRTGYGICTDSLCPNEVN